MSLTGSPPSQGTSKDDTPKKSGATFLVPSPLTLGNCKGGGGRRTVGSLSPACLAALALFALTACAPDLGDRPQIQPPGSYETAKSFAAPAAEWPQEDWWKIYGDPQLDQLIDEALADSPDLKIAAARVRAAEAMGDVAEANLWPTINGQAALLETEQTRNIGFPDAFKAYLPRGWHHAAQIGVGLDYQLDFFGRNRATLAAATSAAEAAKADEAEARLQISTAVATVYATLAQLSADQKVAEDAVRIRKESAALVTQRFQNGLENEGQLRQAEAQVSAAQVEADVVERLITLTRNQLAALLGKGPDRGLAIVLPASNVQIKSAGLPVSLAVDLIGRRPDIVAAKLRAQAAASGIDVANANFYPNVDLTGAYGLKSLDAKVLFQGASAFGQFGPAISLPIFDYGRLTGVYRGTRADYDAAVANYDRTLTGALHDVADAYTNRRGLEAELAHARASLADSEDSYRIVTVRYRGGLSRYTDVLTAETALLQQRRGVADLEAQAFSYDVALVRALGGGYAVKD